ncbi:3-hydroxybutyrate dehydrogenase [Burkholderia gladioli]|uniref:3-hydroxybutyrate dehydrogenase n=17 Tax=Burkholderia TaxID=32008 RepID=UPI0009B7ED9C|nr:3-hydroxybutyrate dehydrogenase [Burkholderia gladioli]
MSNLTGKTAVVTGAASGIGKEIALELAKAGAAVAIADLNQDGANAVAEQIKAAGGKAIGVAMDVTNEDAVNAGIDKVAAEFGSVDILVSNAGIQIVNPIENYSFSDWKKMQAIHVDGAFLTTKAVAEQIKAAGGKAIGVAMDVTNEDAVNAGIDKVAAEFGSVDILVSNAGIQIVNPIENYSFSDWKKMQAIHVDGAFLTTKAALKHMYKDDRGGVVIYMGSVHSHEASPLKSAYVTAKHGLLGLARVLAKEGAKHNVRSHVVCPGFVRTPLVDKQIPEQAKELGISEEDVIKKVMLGNTVDGVFTTVEDVAKTVLFLSAFPSAALTGQSFIVSHGWFMQ